MRRPWVDHCIERPGCHKNGVITCQVVVNSITKCYASSLRLTVEEQRKTGSLPPENMSVKQEAGKDKVRSDRTCEHMASGG